MMEEFGEIAPSVTDVLIHERDKYIAKKIFEESKKGKVVAIVGAGHLKGIQKYLEEKNLVVDLKNLEYVAKKRISILKMIAYAIPAIFAALIIYIYIAGGWEQAGYALLWWIVINGGLSALGTALARGHPFSIITAFFAAPVTSLNPAIAAGWVAGYVEFKMRKPVVKDFKELSRLDSLRDFWNNRVVRLLMVVAFANLGSMIGTFIALPYILSLGANL
jgi:pheromone shutdown-related protein TraB